MLYRHIIFDSVMRHAVVTLTKDNFVVFLRSSGLVIVTPPPSKPMHETLELFLTPVIRLTCEQV